MKTNHVFECFTNIGMFRVIAKSVGHAAHIARKRLGKTARANAAITGVHSHGFYQPASDRNEGGWKDMQAVLK